ncbi:hypothetical protein [Lysinibacillus xylanilyticus]|uniref:hypothetical protein n=1 Tax=Lysinibacillus xylanilyticus TaxID=582475 RepID=UPI002B24985E|nr:hypothetical protein [Lysinibacillus xylanilyticus]
MGQHDVGHSVVATKRGVLRLSSFFLWMLGHALKSNLNSYSSRHYIGGDFH